MALSAAISRSRITAPLCAFLATAALCVLLAAQAQLACSRAMLVSMPGMEMPAASGIALCPVVLVLGLAAALLSAYALATLTADPYRHVTALALARRYVRLPLLVAGSSVLAVGSVSVGLMMALDGVTPAGVPGWLLLGGIVVAVAFATAVAGLGIVRAAIGLSERLVLVLAERAVLRRRVIVPSFVFPARATAPARRVPLLAARRGLRAPPLSAR